MPTVPSHRRLVAACAALAYGLACYQLGAAPRRTLPRVAPHRDADAPAAPPPSRARGADAPPSRCGVVFFYHVPSTGGATVNLWLRRYVAPPDADGPGVAYFTHWGHGDGVGGRRNPEVQARFVAGGRARGGRRSGGSADGAPAPDPGRGGMTALVAGLRADEWRIAHAHHNSLHLNASAALLGTWRSAVEAQGCGFVAAVLFRGALGHALSLYKHVQRYNSTREAWTAHLRTPSGTGHWATQLDYFLYNFHARNPHGVDRDAKVRRALQLLRDHFDVVSAGDHDGLRRAVLRRTGWPAQNMTRTNTYPRDLTFTKSEVEELHGLLEANGDVAFLHEVQARYGGRL